MTDRADTILGIIALFTWLGSMYLAISMAVGDPQLGGRMWWWKRNPNVFLQTCQVISTVLAILIPILYIIFNT